MKLWKVSYLLALSYVHYVTYVTSSCVTRTLRITADDQMELYIDGIQKQSLPNANDWTKADRVVLPCTTSVIAVKGTDQDDVGGILASTDDGFILTNSSWKCTNVYHARWQSVGYDDSLWPRAYTIAAHQSQTSRWGLVLGIRQDAYWIWTSKNTGGDSVVYCRKNIGIPITKATPVPSLSCPSRQLTITADDLLRVYIDGIEQTGLTNANDWTKADTVELPSTARVIAVQGIDRGVFAGILGSTDDGFILTDSSWKCTNVFYRGWQSVDYDDSLWPWAYTISVHDSQTSLWKLVPGIRKDAYWIWTPEYTGGDSVVYCRKNIEVLRSCEFERK